jgi:pimeloyl-ACP methyl ester carboxylesterase
MNKAIPQNSTECHTYHSQEVRFNHGDHTVAGTLALPEHRGPHPALAMINGSGPSDRTDNGYNPPILDHFAQQGIAVLCYDKPGVGGSSGDLTKQTAHDRANEALAALSFLQGREEINEEQVGLWGHSQGGWVAPLAAALSERVAFIIPVSGPGVSPAEQTLYYIAHQMRADGFSEEQISRGEAYVTFLMDAARRGDCFEQVDTAIDKIRDEAWYAYFPVPDASFWGLAVLRDPVGNYANIDYDPVPTLERVKCPALVIFGELDLLVPVAESADIYRRALGKAGNPDASIQVFSQADHGIRIAEPRGFAPGYLTTMSDWVLQHTVVHRGIVTVNRA